MNFHPSLKSDTIRVWYFFIFLISCPIKIFKTTNKLLFFHVKKKLPTKVGIIYSPLLLFFSGALLRENCPTHQGKLFSFFSVLRWVTVGERQDCFFLASSTLMYYSYYHYVNLKRSLLYIYMLNYCLCARMADLLLYSIVTATCLVYFFKTYDSYHRGRLMTT